MIIGILDSDLAGLTFTRYFKHHLPDHRFVYFGDTAHMPYDSKSPDRIRHWALSGAHTLIRNEADVLVIACPTISGVVAESIRCAVDIPVLDCITSLIDQAVQASRKGRIGVLSVRAVVENRIYERQIHTNHPTVKVFSTTCPLLPHLIETGWAQKPESRMIVKKCLQPLKMRQIDTLILGSNHAIFLKKLVQAKIGKRVLPVDPLPQLVKSLKVLNHAGSRFNAHTSKLKRIRVLVNDVTDYHQSLATMYLNQKVTLESVTASQCQA